MEAYRLVSSHYNKETGISTATIATRHGLFTGQSKLLECDKDIESSYSGCMYAEYKAIIKYYKFEKNICRENLKCLTNFYNSICLNKKFNKDSFEAMRLRREIEYLAAELDLRIEQIKFNEERFMVWVKKRAAAARKIRKGKTD